VGTPPSQRTESGDALIGWATDALRFEALLGAGAMGAVYLGRQLRLDRAVAIKVIAPQFATNRAYVDRFDREARTLAKLAHPNVVTCYDFGPLTGPDGKPLLIMVMEFVDGRSIGAIADAGEPLTVREILGLYRQAAHGLAAAHALGIVHRDIKPDNLMVTSSGVAKLADFGLAKADDSAGLTAAGTLMGTPAYMAPEVCQGREPAGASDIYSLGCSLFHSLTGKPPFPSPSSLEVIQCHINTPAPRLGQRVPNFAELDGLLAQAMAKDPAARPTAEGFARQLDSWSGRVSAEFRVGSGSQRERSVLETMEISPLDAAAEAGIPDAMAARSLKSIDTVGAAAGSGAAQERAQDAGERSLRDVDLGLDAPQQTPATLLSGPGLPAAAVQPVEKRGFAVPDYLQPQPEPALPPPPTAAPPSPLPSAPVPSPAASPGSARKPSVPAAVPARGCAVRRQVGRAGTAGPAPRSAAPGQGRCQ
jgi:serine/threonine-protein kinase